MFRNTSTRLTCPLLFECFCLVAYVWGQDHRLVGIRSPYCYFLIVAQSLIYIYIHIYIRERERERGGEIFFKISYLPDSVYRRNRFVTQTIQEQSHPGNLAMMKCLFPVCIMWFLKSWWLPDTASSSTFRQGFASFYHFGHFDILN